MFRRSSNDKIKADPALLSICPLAASVVTVFKVSKFGSVSSSRLAIRNATNYMEYNKLYLWSTVLKFKYVALCQTIEKVTLFQWLMNFSFDFQQNYVCVRQSNMRPTYKNWKFPVFTIRRNEVKWAYHSPCGQNPLCGPMLWRCTQHSADFYYIGRFCLS